MNGEINMRELTIQTAQIEGLSRESIDATPAIRDLIIIELSNITERVKRIGQ